jgi:hypothetical protein
MSQVAQIELSLEHAKELVAFRDAIKKLTSNREFKKIFIEGYFKDEAIRLVGLSADPAVEKHHAEIQEQIKAISYAQQFLRNAQTKGDIAAASIEEHELALEEARFEEGEV